MAAAQKSNPTSVGNCDVCKHHENVVYRIVQAEKVVNQMRTMFITLLLGIIAALIGIYGPWVKASTESSEMSAPTAARECSISAETFAEEVVKKLLKDPQGG